MLVIVCGLFLMRAKAKNKQLCRLTHLFYKDQSSPCQNGGSMSKRSACIKKSEFEKDLIHQATEQDILTKKVNNGLMPNGWYPAEVKKPKSN